MISRNSISSLLKIFSLLIFLSIFSITQVAFALGTIQRVSVDNDDVQGDSNSYESDISSDGRYIAFSSDATNLVQGDTNGVGDVFVYDRDTQTVERISVDNDGVQGNGAAYYVSISSDGRYVAFNSSATNLVQGDTNGVSDVFVYDRDTDTIERVSVDNDGVQGNGAAYYVSISSDGRYVALNSSATNLVSGDTNGAFDTFVYDRNTDTIERVSVDNDGVQGNGTSQDIAMSSDGRYVTFASVATNLVPGDTNGTDDVFVYDRDTDTIERVSVDNDGVQGNGVAYFPATSSDGRYVTFSSSATNLVPGDTNGTDDVFIYDRDTDTIERVSVDNDGVQGNANSYPPYSKALSSDGRYVVFYSAATNLVQGDTNGVSDVFVYDRDTDTIERVSVDNDGVQGNGDAYDYQSAISLDGRYVTFSSSATNLVSGDTNGVDDIFIYDRFPPTTEDSSPSVTTISVGLSIPTRLEYLKKIGDYAEYERLLSHYPQYKSISTPITSSVFTLTGIVQRGTHGILAQSVQQAINQLNFPNISLAVDGIIGPLSEQAIKDTQVLLQVTPDGKWGPITHGAYGGRK